MKKYIIIYAVTNGKGIEFVEKFVMASSVTEAYESASKYADERRDVITKADLNGKVQLINIIELR